MTSPHTSRHPPAAPPCIKASDSSLRCRPARRPRPSRSALVRGSTRSLMGTARSQPTQESGMHSSCKSYFPAHVARQSAVIEGVGTHKGSSLVGLPAVCGA